MNIYGYSYYESLLKKYTGIIGMEFKLPVRDNQALSLIYTPGVAASCIEIQRNIDDSFKYTNKKNSMLIITDNSTGNFNRKGWNEKAAFPYLEGISALYKKLGNIDCYPIVLKKEGIKTGKELAEVVHKIMSGYSGVEFYNVDKSLIDEFTLHKNEIFQKIHEKNEKTKDHKTYHGNFYFTSSSIDRQVLEEELITKGIHFSPHIIYAAAYRVALDCQSYVDLTFLIEKIKIFLIENKEKYKEMNTIYVLYDLIEHAYLILESNNLIYKHCGSYEIDQFQMSREYILRKYEIYLTEGSHGWVNDFPKDYFSIDNSLDQNSLMLHQRYKGIIELKIKIPFQSVNEMIRLLSFKNFDLLSEKIMKNMNFAKEFTYHGNFGAIISNGTAVLGLGDIGALAGLPVMEGKSVLFKHSGGVDILPILLDEHNKDECVRIINIISPSFTIINLEDIKSPECFYIEKECDKLISYPVFHDDQHGTAIVALAGLINALKLSKKRIEEIKVVINGAGAAGLSVSNLLLSYGVRNLIVCDTKGAIYKERQTNMNEFKYKIADVTNFNQEKGDLTQVLIGSDVFIGLSSGGSLKKEMVRGMNKDPIIFALANPIPEIYPIDAFEAGAYIVGTGRSDLDNQINNSLAFPGIFRAAVDTGVETITSSMKIAAAEAIASTVKNEELRVEKILPKSTETSISMAVAKAVTEVACKEKLIKKEGVTSKIVYERIDCWFHDGMIRNNFK